MIVLDALLRLKARLEVDETETLTNFDVEDETTNIFITTFVDLEDDLSQSILEGISLNTRMKEIY